MELLKSIVAPCRDNINQERRHNTYFAHNYVDID